MYYKCVVLLFFINYLRLNYLRLNYLRLNYLRLNYLRLNYLRLNYLRLIYAHLLRHFWPQFLLFLVLGCIIILLVWKGYSLAAKSEFSGVPSLKYPYPVQWLFKIFVFNGMFEIWHKQLLSDKINPEATKVLADAHLQKSLPGIGILLQTTQAFIKIFWELYSVVLKPICEEFIFPVSKIF